MIIYAKDSKNKTVTHSVNVYVIIYAICKIGTKHMNLHHMQISITVENHVTFLEQNGGYWTKPLDSSKTFIDVFVNTGQICMCFK